MAHTTGVSPTVRRAVSYVIMSGVLALVVFNPTNARFSFVEFSPSSASAVSQPSQPEGESEPVESRAAVGRSDSGNGEANVPPVREPESRVGLPIGEGIEAPITPSRQPTGTLGSIEGVIALEGCSEDASSVRAELFPVEGGKVEEYSIVRQKSGAFTLKNIPVGEYKMWIKGSKWLGKQVSVSVTPVEPAKVTLTLLTGDMDGDNFVDNADMERLKAAFDTVPGEGKYNPEADLDCNQSVDVFDLDILVRNFNKQGDSKM